MKIEMQILTRTYNDDEFNNVVSDLENQGWKLKRQYGGKMPNYTGHGAKLEKVCFSSDEQEPMKKSKKKQLPIHDVSNSRLAELEQENKKLRFMIENGLGYEDLENDCC